MTNYVRVLIVGGLTAALPAWAVYAPIPEQEQGKEWTVTLRGDVSHDSNIFGAQTGAISSTVYEVAPKLAFNASVTQQTFASAAYEAIIDHFTNRPGDQTIDSHRFDGRLAHAFSDATNIDLSDNYSIARNPESLLAGIALNTDQSYRRNEFDGRFSTNFGERLGGSISARLVNYQYDNANLANSLDRNENLFGVAGTYDLLPELKGVAEYRYETVKYDTGGANKDKNTHFVIGGIDYALAKTLTATARLGYQWRHRDQERSSNAPYAEFSAKKDYAPGSYFTAGYIYTFEETSNVVRYTDTKVNRFFFNVQHAITPLLVASGSIDYEPSVLQGRRGFSNADETTTRLGLGLSYLPTKNWIVNAHYDYDKVSSDDISRGQNRERVGVGATYTF
jgi:predicted porin